MNRSIVSLLFLVSLVNVGRAQQPAPLHPLQPSDTSSPAATLSSLIDSCNELQRLIREGAMSPEREGAVLPAAERILDCLDLSEWPKELRGTAGIECALFLKEVLDRIDLPPITEIPGADNLDGDQPLFRWQVPGTRMFIARVEEGPQRGAYLFSPPTVRRAAEFYRMVKQLPYRDGGPLTSPGLYDAYIAATKKQPTQTADTSSPRGTLTLFIDSCNELFQMIKKQRHFDRGDPRFHQIASRIISCLDTSELPEYAREYFDAEAAVCLKEVLDRIPLPPVEQIPGIESVEAADGTEALVRWQIPRTQIAISKMEEGPRRGEFLFTAGTVALAPEIYDRFRKQPYQTNAEHPLSEGLYDWWLASPGNPTVAAIVDRLPVSFQGRFVGMALWQWIALIVAVPLTLALMIAAFRWARICGEKVRERSLLRYWMVFAVMVVAVFIPIAFKHVAFEFLTIRGTPSYVINFCSDLVFLFGAMGLVMGGSSRAAESIVALPHVSPKSLDANLIRIIFRVLGIVAAAVVFLEGGRYLGFPLTTLIASAGIGGLAIALSAQGLIKGLFGTVTVLMDKPYRVGERIVVKGHDGFVEEIGLRSTKIRALNNHVISIPNDQIADAEIENIGKRKHIRRLTDLHIPIDTPREKLEAAVECLRTILKNHEGMDSEFPPRVYFTEFNPDSFNIRVIYWYMPPDLWLFHEFSEKINLAILEAFEEQGIQLSLPIRHSYWKRDEEQGPLEVVVRNPED